MDEMEEKLGSILGNPQMMQQIMAMAQSMGNSQPNSPPPPAPPENPPALAPPGTDIDFSMLQRLSGLAGQSGINKNERALLNALGPYLSRERVLKLERAMRAEKMARIASTLLSQGGVPFLSGR